MLLWHLVMTYLDYTCQSSLHECFLLRSDLSLPEICFVKYPRKVVTKKWLELANLFNVTLASGDDRLGH